MEDMVRKPSSARMGSFFSKTIGTSCFTKLCPNKYTLNLFILVVNTEEPMKTIPPPPSAPGTCLCSFHRAAYLGWTGKRCIKSGH